MIKTILFLLFLFNANMTKADSNLPLKLSDYKLFKDLKNLTPAENVYFYDVNFPTWADGAKKQRWVFIPDGEKIEFSKETSWKVPVGTILIKQFDFDRRIETRLSIKFEDSWHFISYLWDENQEDATRVDSTQQVIVHTDDHPNNFKWSVPAANKCVMCHTKDNEVLGLKTEQFGLNQLQQWNRQQRFSKELDLENQNLHFLPDYKVENLESVFTIDELARSYLHVNCATCHQPNGFVPTDLNFSLNISPLEMNAINKNPAFGNMGVVGAKIISPGRIDKSLTCIRMEKKGSAHMPYFGSTITDPIGLRWIQSWIESTPAQQ